MWLLMGAAFDQTVSEFFTVHPQGLLRALEGTETLERLRNHRRCEGWRSNKDNRTAKARMLFRWHYVNLRVTAKFCKCSFA